MRCTPCKWVVVLVLSLTSLAVPAITVAQTPTFNVELQYHVLPGGRPMPFSGVGKDATRERLQLSVSKIVPVLGVTGAMSYGFRNSSLHCAVSRRLIGPLGGTLERDWDLRSRQPMASKASLALSLTF